MTDPMNIKKSRLRTPDIESMSAADSLHNVLSILPNPDPILRKSNKSQTVYEDIMHDAHVMGELRAIRGNLLSYEWSIQPGGDDAASMRAYEITKRVYDRRPSINSRWPDLVWDVWKAVLRGFSVQQVKWAAVDGVWLPVDISSWTNHRFVFGKDSDLRLRTSSQPQGKELTPGQWLVTRHMPDGSNPYGTALLSTCFWPYVFKHSGWKGFVKFCDKYGLPWAVGRYQPGTSEADIKELIKGLAGMVDDGVAAIQEGNAIELIERKPTGDPLHLRLINSCNAEMSKALVSSTLAIEQKGEGARAATETHDNRGRRNIKADRQMVTDAFNQLNEWIAQVNVANAMPAKFVFTADVEANPDRARFLNEARYSVAVPEAWAYEFLRIPMPRDGEPVLPLRTDLGQQLASPGGGEFSAPTNGDWHEFSQNEVDAAIAAMVDQIREIAANAASYEALLSALQDTFFDLDTATLEQALERAMQAGLLEGINDATEEEG